MPEITTEQAGSAAVWFSTNAGVTSLVLAVVCICLSSYLVWREIQCRKTAEANNSAWMEQVRELTEAWGRRVDQMRGDTKDAFGQVAILADKMVDAMNSLKIEIARMSARRGHDD